MINNQNKQDIIDKADIFEVVSDFVKLKKAGTNYTGLCPFHNEKTGSFHVNPSKQFYKCFGCGAGGDAVKFIMDHEKRTFPEALRYLAAKYNILISEEKADPEVQKQMDLNEKIFQLNDQALKFYQKNATDSQIEYINKRFTKDETEQWQIGLAPDRWDGLLIHFKKLKVSDELIDKSHLFGFSEKKHNYYDFFRNRVMFPITDNLGRVAGFGGRTMEENEVKYLNSPETDIYQKSRTLYGLNFARKEISKKDNCIIVEGYTDVISMHTAGIINTVAPCGTALTIEQLQLIRRYTKNLTLIYDADPAGINAARKNGIIAIENGFDVYICSLPEGEDPDSFFKQKGFDEAVQWLEDNKRDFIINYSSELFSSKKDDPIQENDSVNEICKLLSFLDKDKQNIYVDKICQINSRKTKLFTERLNEYRKEDKINDRHWMPKDLDPVEFEKWGFYCDKNEYYFRTSKGIEKCSNFIMIPIFHVDGAYDSSRIYELINVHKERRVIILNKKEMVTLKDFQEHIEGKGNFMFWGSLPLFQKLKLKLYEETTTCKEIKILGWQKEGFWAWSNGIININGFIEINEYGVVKNDGQNYFIPAFSKIFIDDRSVFIDDRKFKYVESDIILKQWTNLFINVFRDNAKIGIAFWVATVFRDHLIHIFKNFPLLNLFGPKGTGKSEMAKSLSYLFGLEQTAFNIHNGTKAGMAEHIQQFSNGFAVLEEYKNSIDVDKIEAIKAIYDAVGRSRMNMDKGRKKETTEVNSGVVMTGQEMPTADVALFSRVIFLKFHQTEFNHEEMKIFDDFKAMQHRGLSKLTSELLKHRKYFEDNFHRVYNLTLKEFTEETENSSIEVRILRNMATVISAFRTIEDVIDFGLSYDDLKPIGIKAIKDQNSQTLKSNEVAVFWNNLEAMFDENILIDKWHFKINYVDHIKTTKNEIRFNEPLDILKFKFTPIYKLYAENVRRQGIKPMSQDTLKYYLENSKHFKGVQRSCKFTFKAFDNAEGRIVEHKTNTSAFCFDYKKLGINLQRKFGYELDNPDDETEEDEDIQNVQQIIEDNLPF
jgi:DNA primase catalytic core